MEQRDRVPQHADDVEVREPAVRHGESQPPRRLFLSGRCAVVLAALGDRSEYAGEAGDEVQVGDDAQAEEYEPEGVENARYVDHLRRQRGSVLWCQGSAGPR